jgi:AcrR family transcriptional regulator
MARAARLRTDPEEVRARIVAVAEEHFRRVGYAKTAVADIAVALGMSPANVYRFFASKAAINEAICERLIREQEERAWAVTRLNASAAERLVRLVLELHRYNKANLLNERRMHDMVTAAFDENWSAIKGHIERVAMIIETVIRDGVEAGEFAVDDVPKAARCVKAAFVPFWHPQLIAQCIDEDLESQAREVARFVALALAAKPG